ncbi:MAG: aminopeptidase [Victivallales bacterium]|nr:aminopeptidase [Victivallales bacterium]
MEQSLLQDYARLIVEAGVNPDKGQAVMVYAELDQPDFVRMVVKSLYEHGVSEVILRWEDSPCRRLDYQYVDEALLATPKPWLAPRLEWQVEQLPATLYLESTPPDIFDGLDSEKIARAEGALRKFAKPYRDRRDGKHQWCIATVPSVGWARKVFPGISDNDAVERLWKAIMAACYVDGNAVENWKRIQGDFDRRAKILNDYQLKSLHYKASNGTDFMVGLIPNSIFEGGECKDLSNRAFQANLPSEELFTTPMRGVAEGLLVATRPLLTHTGALIDKFSIRFHEGKAVEWCAEKGQRDLDLLIATDEGAAYIGECALVPFSSPINQSGLLYYSTIFDENAGCHFALGAGFNETIVGYEKMTLEELHALGVNDSTIHEDFVVGCADLEITGTTTDGREIPVFRKGEWCF